MISTSILSCTFQNNILHLYPLSNFLEASYSFLSEFHSVGIAFFTLLRNFLLSKSWNTHPCNEMLVWINYSTLMNANLNTNNTPNNVTLLLFTEWNTFSLCLGKIWKYFKRTAGNPDIFLWTSDIRRDSWSLRQYWYYNQLS